MPDLLLRNKRNTGNTTSEYVLIAFLILVLLITVFTTIGKGLNTSMLGLKSEFQTRVSGAKAAEDKIAAAFDEQNPENSEGSFTKLNCDPLVKTRCVIHTEPPAAVGANGGSAQASFMDRFIALLRRFRILPPEDPEALIKALAKRGHQIAFLEEIWEKISKYGDKEQNKLRNIDIVIGDKKYSVKELSELLKSLSEEVREKKEDIIFSNLPPDEKAEVVIHSDTIQQNAQTSGTEADQKLNEEIVTDTAPPGTIPPTPPPPPVTEDTTSSTQQPSSGGDTTPSRSEETRGAANGTCTLIDPANPPPECMDERPSRRRDHSSETEPNNTDSSGGQPYNHIQ